MKKLSTLIIFIICSKLFFAQIVDIRIWVNTTQYNFDSFDVSSFFVLIDSMSIELEETDILTFEIFHTIDDYGIMGYGTTDTPIDPLEIFCYYSSSGIGQTSIQGVTKDYTPFISTNNNFFCSSNDEIYFAVYFCNILYNECGSKLFIKCRKTHSLLNDVIQSSSKINLYPNPTTNVIHIEYDGVLENSNLIVYSIDGIFVNQITLDNNSRKIDLETTNLAPGTYFIQINQEDKQLFNEKFVIIR